MTPIKLGDNFFAKHLDNVFSGKIIQLYCIGGVNETFNIVLETDERHTANVDVFYYYPRSSYYDVKITPKYIMDWRYKLESS
jgi:hypothetical protein